MGEMIQYDPAAAAAADDDDDVGDDPGTTIGQLPECGM